MLANKIRTNWAMALARGNADVILSNLRFVRGGAADEDRYGQFSDQHSRWNKKHLGAGPRSSTGKVVSPTEEAASGCVAAEM